MAENPNHTVIIHTHFGHDITAPVIYVKDLGDNRALVQSMNIPKAPTFAVFHMKI